MPRKALRTGNFVDNVKIKNYKNRENLIRKIVAKHGVRESKVRHILQYNLMTVSGFATVTGLTIGNVHTKLRGYVRAGQIFWPLNTCDPFNDLYLKFIYRNAKCQSLIEKNAGYEREMGNAIDAEDELKQENVENFK